MRDSTYNHVVDFVGNHADHHGDTIGESYPALYIFLCILCSEHCYFDDLHRDADSLELSG